MARQDGIEARINEFTIELYRYYETEFAKRGYNRVPEFVAEYGPKNARIAQVERKPNGDVLSRSVYCFVDLSNGDILKSAGWKAPAKGKRGSIWNDGYDVGNGKPCDLFGSGLYTKR